VLAYLRFINDMVDVGFKVTRISQNNGRDAAMAENLIWLANERYKGRKLIVWAASFHLVRNPTTIDTSLAGLNYEGLVTMGQRVHDALGDAVYTIATVSHHGRSGVADRPNVYDIELPPAGSVEDWFAGHKAAYQFVDLDRRRQHKNGFLAGEVVARPLGYVPLRAIWGDHFDAFLYIEKMFPSTPEGGFPSDPGR